jgi:Domain of unknown function (DUF1841)
VTDAAGYSRDALRKAYVDAWTKARAGSPLTPLEALLADVVALHPEYHATIEDLEDTLGHEQSAAGDAENPFLHLGLHVAVREQLAIDRPPGVAAIHRRAIARFGDAHAADHLLADALGRTLWEAQRAGTTPDERRYLALARAALER